MSWVKVDDGFADHPKVLMLSDSAFRLHSCAMCWAARRGTDGFIRTRDLGILISMLDNYQGSPTTLVDELLKAKLKPQGAALWELADGGWQIHDFTDYNPLAAEVAAERQAKAEKMRTARAKAKETSERARNVPGTCESRSAPPSRPDPDPHPIPDLSLAPLGKHPPRAHKGPPAPTMVEPASIGPAWQALVAKVPSLAPPRAYATATGLNPNEEGPLSRGYEASRSAGYKASDIVALEDWITEGGLRTRTSPREYLCRNLCTALDDAQKWREAGKPPLGRERSPPPTGERVYKGTTAKPDPKLTDGTMDSSEWKAASADRAKKAGF